MKNNHNNESSICKNIINEIKIEIENNIFENEILFFDDSYETNFLNYFNKEVFDIYNNSISKKFFNIEPHKLIHGNKLIVLIKKIIRKLIKFYIVPIVSDINSYNLSVFDSIKNLQNIEIYINSLEERIIILENKFIDFSKLNYTLGDTIDLTLQNKYHYRGWFPIKGWDVFTNSRDAYLALTVYSNKNLIMYINVCYINNNKNIKIYANEILIYDNYFILGQNIVYIPKTVFPNNELIINFCTEMNKLKNIISLSNHYQDIDIGLKSFMIIEEKNYSI